MRKITSICVLLFCCIAMVTAQDNGLLRPVENGQTSDIQRELQAAADQNNSQTIISVEELMERMSSGNQGIILGDASSPSRIAGSGMNMLSPREQQMVRHHILMQSRDPEIDIIPTAGATETFVVAVGDFVYDPGGPGVNYPNCDCITTTTLDGATEIDFTEYVLFLNFDWLAIYDGADTTGTVLWDSGPGGANENADDLADMIAQNGSTTFIGTSGALTLEFRASAVVDMEGFTAEVTAIAGGGTACSETNPSNGPDGGYFSSDGPTAPLQVIASDATVPIDEDFTLNTINANLYTTAGGATVASADIIIYGDAAGIPDVGNVIDTQLGVVPVNQTFLSNQGAFDIYDVEFDMGGVFLAGQGGTTTSYWISIYMTLTDGGDGAWEFSTVSVVGNVIVFSSDSGATWTPIAGQDAVYTWSGDCTPRVAPNDECADAFAIACGETMVGDTTGVTDSNGVGGPDQWFSFTGTGTQEVVTLSLCDGGTGYDSQLFVYTDCTFATLVASNDDSCGLQSELTFISDGTTTYFIAVDGFAGGSEGAYSLEVSCGPVTEDFCEGALTIECGETIAGTTVGATVDTNAQSCGQSINSPGVWYTFTDDFGFPTDYVVSLCDGGTDYDSKLTIYEGTDCGTLVCVTDNDDACGLQSEVTFSGDGNGTYYILVHGFGGQSGNYSLNVDCVPVPPPNDMIANAIDVDQIGTPYTDPGVVMPAATTEAGNPAGCNIDGANGVWYKFTASGDGNGTATVVSPAGSTSVLWFSAPDENATETDLTLIDQFDNQCLPSTETTILTGAGLVYYVFVVNTDGQTDITIDGLNLGVGDNVIEGFTYYPNPANDVINLNALDTIESATIFNILGQKVVEQTIDANNARLNVANLAVGAYVMKVSVNGQIGTYKIIKQ